MTGRCESVTTPRVSRRGLALGCLLMAGCSGRFVMERASQQEGDAGTSLVSLTGLDGGASRADAATTPPALSDLGDASVSTEAVVSLLTGLKYRASGFRLVNDGPFPSTVAPDKTIDLWVSDGAYEAFKRVVPERAGSNVSMPVGTVVVREVLGAGEKLETITVMIRLPEGAFPLGGDWWYASADPDGKIRQKDGAPVAGLLESCGTCHLRRSHDDYLFGTPEEFLPD